MKTLAYQHLIAITPESEMNGAGSKGFGWLVPDQLGLVNIEKAANIHDACYYWIGRQRGHPGIIGTWRPFPYSREVADKIFYRNMQTINKEMSPTKLGYYARKPIIWSYYQAVKKFGGKFANKPKKGVA